MKIYGRLLKYIKPYWKRLVIAMICMSGVGIMTAASAMVVKQVLDDVFIKKDEFMLKLIPAAVIIIFIAKGVLYYLQAYLMSYIGQSTVRTIRDELYNQIQRQSLAFFSRNSTGSLMSRITYDVNLVSTAVSDAFSSLLRDSFSIVALVCVVFYRDWKLASIAILVYPIAFYPIVKLGRKLKKVGTKSQETMGYINAFLHETIAGARIVKAFGMENYETARFAEANRKFFKLIVKSYRIKHLNRPAMEILSAGGIATIIWYGGMKVMKGTLTTGEFFSFMTALFMLYKPVKQLSNVNSIIQEGIAAAERIFSILDAEPEIRDKPGAVEIDTLRKGIEFRDVFFSYGDEYVLKGVNLKEKKGERVAIVGGSGRANSTLVNLIPRFYDVTSGYILIDGMDIRDVKVESLRSLIGIVTQETILFNDTVRNNIVYGHQERSEAEIVEAAKAALAHDFITELPMGYDTVIGEQGLRLSGGQRQRIAIARAILKNAPILILDEATSALDTESEKLVQAALNNLMKDRTTFVVAHRLSTVQDADRIVVLSKGEIVEEGNHEELFALNGQYRQLCNNQLPAS